MPWLEQKKNWIPRYPQEHTHVERAYSVARAADMLGVSRMTIYKYLSVDEPESALIPPNAWFRLPTGHIRIKEWIIVKLKNREI